METHLSTAARPNRSRHLSTVKDRRQLSCKDPHIQQRPYPTLKSLVLKANELSESVFYEQAKNCRYPTKGSKYILISL